MHYKKIEFKIPVFFGCLGALVVCALLAIRWPQPVHSPDTQDMGAASEETAENIAADFFARTGLQNRDRILEMYRQPETQGSIMDFFTEICPSREIIAAILVHADAFNIAPSLAFALGWEESRLNPLAVNEKNRDESIDRGLFQLNNRSFPRLDVQTFFNPDRNAYYGMSHLRHCLDTGGTEVSALAMYNAGAGRVRNAGTPKTTLDYISRILENRRIIENHFLDWEVQLQQQLDDVTEIAEAEPEPDYSRLVPLIPLGIR